MTSIVFDSSVLISISEKCFLRVLRRFGRVNDVRFLISESVFRETVTRPESIRRFELNAVRLKAAVSDGWISLVPKSPETEQLMNQVSVLANSAYSVSGKPLELLQSGELEAMALYKISGAAALAIDERTCRMMLEDPLRLKALISKRLDKSVELNPRLVSQLSVLLGHPPVVRSCDLVSLAFEQELFEDDLVQSKQGLEAALWSLKFAGCAVSGNEIDAYLQKV